MLGRLIYLLFSGLSWFSDLLTLIGRSFDGFVARLTDRIGWMSSGDRWFSGIFQRILSPFRWLVDALDRMGGRRETPVVDPLAEEQQIKVALQKKAREAERLEALSQTWVSRLGRMAMVPVQGFTDFFWLFVNSRPTGVLIWSLPLIAILGILSVILYQTRVMDRSGLAARYEIALSDAIRAGETEQADLFRLKLEQLGMRTDRGEYRTALALAETGNIAEAYERMMLIASETEPGFPGAHFWIAQSLIDGMLNLPTQDALGLALVHLQHLRTRMGLQPEILFLEGLAYYRLEQFPAAINSLNQIGSRLPAATALLMEIHQRNGATQLAREHAINLHRQLKQVVAEGQELTDDQLRWQSVATTLIGDLDLAQASVDQWYRSNPTSPDAKLFRGTTLLNRFDRWMRQPDFAGLDTAVQTFQEACGLIPDDRMDLILRRTFQVLRQKSTNPILEQFYQKLLAQDQLSGVLLEYIGTDAASNSQWETADKLYARAVVASPTWARTYNNWAFVLNSAYPNRRTEALEYANRAIELEPDNPDYRETRGMIYYSLQAYEQAIEDLEIAINGVHELESIHAALADSHRQLGRIDLAEIYEQQTQRRRRQ